MFAPTTCLYHRLPPQQAKKSKETGKSAGAKGKRPKWMDNWAVVIPDVHDLETFADQRRHSYLNPDYLDVASLGDAALRFAAEFATRQSRRLATAGCRVIAMGNVSFYPNQNVRKRILEFSPAVGRVDRYRALQRIFPNRYTERTRETPAPGEPDGETGARGYVRVPSGRGRIAENLVQGDPWYVRYSLRWIGISPV